tara:strand:- start:1299 stop:3425 length:2127 start_codon:yes stop_codon:yes gene_type:complete
MIDIMGSYSVVLFSLLIISSIIIVSSFESSFADEILATSTGFEYSTILELKNSRGNTASIDSVRIWLGDENEFKIFKTEQGWLGKKQLNGVIEFKSQNTINPGEGVKFGIKTTEKNPIINWKAIDSTGKVISSSSTKITNKEISENQSELNQPQIVTIKDKSTFRFIPQNPSSDSNFRVIGENFVPNQSLDFYIENEFQKSIQVDDSGRILFTSKTPNVSEESRTEFILRDAGGNEKSISLRVQKADNREFSEITKLSIGNTPKDVKRGETITLNGSGTPNTTLTITSKRIDGDILKIDTIQVGSDGKWSYDNLFSPTLTLGQVYVEINDGKSSMLRNFEVISAKIINITTEASQYQIGDLVSFSGYGIPNEKLTVTLEDEIGAEIFSEIIGIGDSGKINFDVKIQRGSMEGTYVLYSYQGGEEGITSFGVGQEPVEIIILKSLKLNYDGSDEIEITVQGKPNTQVSLIIVDSTDREEISDSINLGTDGIEVYKIAANKLSNGIYTVIETRTLGETTFTVGFTKGSGNISLQTTRSDYKVGEQVLMIGSTERFGVLLDVTINDSNGKLVKSIETFSDRFGVFKIDNFKIPRDGERGMWKVTAKSGGNFYDTEFMVLGDENEMYLKLDKSSYNNNDLVSITGSGAVNSGTVTIRIFDFVGNEVSKLNITAKGNGDFQTVWQISSDMVEGEYEMTISDGKRTKSIKFMVN